MPHPQSADSLERLACGPRQGLRLAVADLLDRDQRHARQDFGVLQLAAKLIVAAHFRQHQPLFCRGHLQIVRTPLQNRILDGLGALTASEQVERPSPQSRIEVERHDVTAVAGCAEKGQFQERAAGEVPGGGRPSVHGLPPALEEAAEPPQRLSDIQRDVLRFPRTGSPQRRKRDASRCQSDGRHAAKAKRRGEDRILAVEGELAAAVRGAHSHVRQHVVHRLAQVEFGAGRRMGQTAIERLAQGSARARGHRSAGCGAHPETLL